MFNSALLATVAVGVSAVDYPTYEAWLGQQNTAQFSLERKTIYDANVESIKALNADGTAVFEVNQYSDLTTAEWKEVKGIKAQFGVDPEDGRTDQCNFQDPDDALLSADEINAMANDAIDWVADGAVTPVKNQGSSGTCGYFSSITVMEGINVVQGGNKLVSLSEQEVIDCCTPGNGGCNGWPGQEIAWYGKSSIMAATEQSYPYKGSSAIPKPDGTACHSDQGTPTTATSSGRICLANDPASINAHMKALGPNVWMIDASCLQSYSSGVITSSSCSGSGGTWPHYNGIDHATTMVGSGVDGGVEYWKVKNSWGSSWGEKGYYRVKKDAAGATKPMLNAIGGIFGVYPSSTTV